MEPDPYLHHVHPKNYSFVQQHPSGELGGFQIRYDADGRVVRNTPLALDIPKNAAPCRIALMGDSFTEAGQVPFEASFAGLLEEAARRSCEVRNYGVRSYSPAIYLVQWTRDVQPWHPTHVFLLLFGNDVREDVNFRVIPSNQAAIVPDLLRRYEHVEIIASGDGPARRKGRFNGMSRARRRPARRPRVPERPFAALFRAVRRDPP